MKQDIFEACQRKSSGETNLTWNQLAELFDIPSGKILKDRYLRAKNKRSHSENPEEPLEEIERPTKESLEIKNDGSQISVKLIWMFNNETKSKEYVLNAHGYDPEEWEVVNVISNIWQSPRPKDKGVRDLYQSKLTVKPKVTKGVTFADVDAFFKNYTPKRVVEKSSPRQWKSGGLVLEVCLSDVHISNESLPFDVLSERVDFLLSEIERRSVGLVFDEIKLVQLGDLFHIDNYQRQTTSGTQVTSVGTYPSMFDSGMELMIKVIDRLSRISKLEMVNVYGNHDRISSYTLAKALEAYYRTDENIKIDTTHDVIKFRKFGINSVAFLHGDMNKNHVYDAFFKDVDGRKMFGDTRFSEVHAGHIHHELSLEKHGVITRYLPSITIPDQWHTQNGFTGAKQGTHCFLWDKENGMEALWVINYK